MTDLELLAQALKALELEDMACRYEKDPTPEHIANLITALRERLKQPEQEPVALNDGRLTRWPNGDIGIGTPMLKQVAVSPEIQELLSRTYEEGVIDGMQKQMQSSVDKAVNSMTRTWQGLTDEEIRDLWSWAMTAEAERTATTQQHAFARAIEDKLRSKNT